MTDRPLYGVASLRSEHVRDTQAEMTLDAVPAEMLHGVFAADWRQIARVRLAAGATLGPRSLSESEVMFFVLSGRGRAFTCDGETIDLQCETAITLIKNEILHVQATAGGLELYVIEIGVPTP